MSENAFLMYKLASQGYCCSQILVLMDLKKRGIENVDYVKAMAGLCIGTGGSGRTCGLSGEKLDGKTTEEVLLAGLVS